MKLIPEAPPGRITRKARDFEADIVRLRAQGYTLDAIRQALNAVGMRVSISTVRREALRCAVVVPAPAPEGAMRQTSAPSVFTQDPSAITRPSASANPSAPSAWPSGKDVAQAYTSGLVTNQFVRTKEKR